jgi:hypothetical protein
MMRANPPHSIGQLRPIGVLSEGRGVHNRLRGFRRQSVKRNYVSLGDRMKQF